MITKEQIERWNQLISDCKGKSKNINVGGKFVREMLIDMDEWIMFLLSKRKDYSAEDMKSFGDFVFQNHHKRGFMDNSFDKLIELWEEKK